MNSFRPRGISRLKHRLRRTGQRPSDRAALVAAILTLLLGTSWAIVDNNNQVEVAAVIIIVVVLSSLVLTMRAMLLVAATVLLCLGLVVGVHGLHPDQLSASSFAMIAVTVLVGVVQAGRRDRLGLKAVSAETVIALIRDRLLVQAQLPSVPAGWNVEIEQRPADGAAISGDFVASRLVCNGESQVLHLAVIDVSGCGMMAGPRALLLSGAVGGLLGSVPPDQFLAATNDYLGRQEWSLGLVSAIYLWLDLTTGEYSLRAAGHPPALHFRPTQAPPWRTSLAAGTVLGVPHLTGVQDSDVLRPGEALFLYTDGVVEDRTRDIDAGTLRLKDSVEALASQWRGGDGSARLLIERVPTKLDDDRTVVMVQRRPVSQPSAPANAGRAPRLRRGASMSAGSPTQSG